MPPRWKHRAGRSRYLHSFKGLHGFKALVRKKQISHCPPPSESKAGGVGFDGERKRKKILCVNSGFVLFREFDCEERSQ